MPVREKFNPKSPIHRQQAEDGAKQAALAEREHERSDQWRPAVHMDRSGMPETIEQLAAREQSLARRAIPALRNKWPALVEADERLAALDVRAAEIAAEVERLREQLRTADDEDADAFRQWIEDDRRGDRPEVRRPHLEQTLHSLEVEAAGIAAAVASAEEARVRVITAHRRVLVRDAGELVERRRAEALAALVEAERARQALCDAAGVRLWSRTYPDASASVVPPYHEVGGGLPLPLTTLGVKSAIPAATLYQAMREDIGAITETMSNTHRKLLVDAGEVEAVHDPSAAIWAAEEPPSERRRRHDEVVRLFREEYQRDPLNEYEFDQFVNILSRENRLPL